MSYKYSRGSQVIGDLKAKDDTQRDTIIDFGEDQIQFQTSGSTRMTVTNDGVQVTGLMIGDQYAFPSTDGTNGQVLQTDGAGNLSFASVSGGGGSSVLEEVKIVDPSFSSGSEANRSFTYKIHRQYDLVAANTWHDLISWRPYITGTTTDPGASTFWAIVGFKVHVVGSAGAGGAGSFETMGNVTYNGSSAASSNTSTSTLGSNVSFTVSQSGWVTTLQINANQANASSFTGVGYVELYLTKGQGSNGNNIEWSIT